MRRGEGQMSDEFAKDIGGVWTPEQLKREGRDVDATTLAEIEAGNKAIKHQDQMAEPSIIVEDDDTPRKTQLYQIQDAPTPRPRSREMSQIMGLDEANAIITAEERKKINREEIRHGIDQVLASDPVTFEDETTRKKQIEEIAQNEARNRRNEITRLQTKIETTPEPRIIPTQLSEENRQRGIKNGAERAHIETMALLSDTNSNIEKLLNSSTLNAEQENEINSLIQASKEAIRSGNPADMIKARDFAERAYNLTLRAERINTAVNKIDKKQALNQRITLSNPTTSPPTLFSKIKNFFGFGKK